MKKKTAAGIGGIILVVVATLWGTIVSNVEQAKYTVIASEGTIEVRNYTPLIVAQTNVTGDRKQAIQNGFRRIADYIFGNNVPAQKVAMTAPVIQQPEGDHWKIGFVMPKNYSMATLPKPNNSDIDLVEVSAKRFVVVRFSGTASDDSLKTQTDKLKQFIQAKKFRAIAAPVFAFYNPPWTLPFLRRNEVMVEIAIQQ